MLYDLLIKGGRVIDPATQSDQIADIAISNGFISALAPDIDASEAREIIAATGWIVTPGLIDFHAHALFLSGLGLGAELDQICRVSGVTTLVDAGSAGAATFPVFKELLIDTAETRLLAFLHISSIGLADISVGESTYMNLHHPKRAAETANAYPEIIVGIKVRQQSEVVGENGLEPLIQAKQAALASGLATMVHVTHPAVTLARILDHLDQGDIVSHIFHGRGPGLLDDGGRVLQAVLTARQKGIWFDAAHGGNHFDFDVARIALKEGFLPDIISTDLTRANMRGAVKSLPHTLSKYLNLGMDLSNVIACATSHPAAILGKAGSIGTLSKGAVADVALFEIQTGDFTFEDSNGHSLSGEQSLRSMGTVRNGRVSWQRRT